MDRPIAITERPAVRDRDARSRTAATPHFRTADGDLPHRDYAIVQITFTEIATYRREVQSDFTSARQTAISDGDRSGLDNHGPGTYV
jgi:hypothetical protein